MKKIIFSMLIITVFTACDDSFLDRYPETSISKENFFNTEEDLMMYTNSFYNFSGTGIYTSDASTDNQVTTGVTEIKNMMTGNPTAETINGGWDWETLRNINFFLENFKNADLPEETLNHYEGLARMFRANFYMGMVKRYSDVPWYDYVISTDNEEALFADRDPRDFVVEKIFEDYAFAVEHIQTGQPDGAVDKWVALAFQARHALYEGTYRKYHNELKLENTANSFLQIARDASEKIMEEGGFSLYNTGNPTEDYGSLFNNENLRNNPEILLMNISENDLKNSGWWAFMFGNYESSPSRDLMMAYLNADGSYYSSVSDFETNQFVGEFANRDARLSQTYAFPGWELINTSTYSQGGGIYIQQLQKNFSGYHQLKGFVNNTDQSVMNNLDIPLIRYAEVLLTYAEAKAELGELSQADLDMTVNKVRERAGMPALSIGVAIDPWQQAKYPNVSSAILLEIRRERRVELALEGHRMGDLMRWGAGDVLEEEPVGLYFPSLGKFDLTGDGVGDVFLIPNTESIPEEKELNENDVPYIYYRVGPQGSDASFYLTEGDKGYVVATPERGVFEAPKYYYRPVPQNQVTLNPNLTQIFGW
ncbi:RagB/SusD family nutrient uptake outer membrane protein [Flammeovirgaceae bacterium SG7u.111]|nr:RagB/SusD family nutrient uptake outer membrane protein [Flammeovirgaceae bacterium SG7u.132]WPO34893.1 RagB/SusD family nutrient uptake outer membrane protein [Flammeovirgaceae bacterium SG7u.111]